LPTGKNNIIFIRRENKDLTDTSFRQPGDHASAVLGQEMGSSSARAAGRAERTWERQSGGSYRYWGWGRGQTTATGKKQNSRH